MKKLVTILTVLCLIVSACLVAFAYGQAPATEDWVSNISCDAEGNITITTTAEMKAAGAHTWQVAIFNAPTTYADGDAGFWEIYKRSDTGAFEKDAEYATDATYIGGKNGGGAAGDTLTVAATGLEAGKTYYAMFCANNDGANGWSWLNKSYEFTVPAANVENTPGFEAIPFKDGVLLTYNTTDGWAEVVMSETPLTEEFNNIYHGFEEPHYMYNRSSLSNNNAIQNSCYITPDSTFDIHDNGTVTGSAKPFVATPGKTYYFYILQGPNWAIAGKIVYTVPEQPSLEVSANGLTNTLTYTLVDNGKPGTIFRYDSLAKAQAGGNDYDKKIDVTYGGAPVTDTVVAGGTYYYVLLQDDAPKTFYAENQSSNAIYDFTFTATQNGVDIGFSLNENKKPEGTTISFTVPTLYNLGLQDAENAAEVYKRVAGNNISPNLENITDHNGAIASNKYSFTFDGTNALEYHDTHTNDNGSTICSLSLKRGEAYSFILVSLLSNGTWPNSAIAFYVPELMSSEVVSATNTEPTPTEESWITDATVAGDGLVNLTFGNLGDDTSWSEIAIFTEDRGALDWDTISANKLPRPGNHSVWGGHKEGTVGSNGQFAFDLVDGTTYYVYVIRNVGGSWDNDHLMKPFSFTYTAPQATPEPTPVPTPEPTVTVVPDDDDNDTADLSVVLYAVTALAATGTVVAIKRKRK